MIAYPRHSRKQDRRSSRDRQGGLARELLLASHCGNVARSIETTRYARRATAASPFDTEEIALLALVREAKTLLDEQFHPNGYNVGPVAGQTVMHLHVIPRYAGDVDDPRGGVRGAVPEKRVY